MGEGRQQRRGEGSPHEMGGGEQRGGTFRVRANFEVVSV